MPSSGKFKDQLTNSPVLKSQRSQHYEQPRAGGRYITLVTGSRFEKQVQDSVMGGRCLSDGSVMQWRPFRIYMYKSRGNEDVAGSGRAAEICKWWTADRYYVTDS